MLRNTYRLAIPLLASGLFTSLSCTGAQNDDAAPNPVVEASGGDPSPASSSRAASDVPVEALRTLEKVYVPLLPGSMDSLDDALANKGYGNVNASDFRPRFEHVATELGPAVVAYSSGDWIERESLFQPMTVHQWLEAALEDLEAQAVIINPGHPGQTLALTRAEVVEAMGWLPEREPLPMEIYIAQ